MIASPEAVGRLVSQLIFAVGMLAASATVTLAGGDLFERDEALRIRIEGPFTTLAAQTRDDFDWLDGKLTVLENDGTESDFDIRLKGRSMTRRNPRVCDFPPFWIDFRKGQIKDTRFAGNERLKVVSHCREKPASFDQFIHIEYLVYRSYLLLTDQGFRARLASIDYVDTDSGGGTRGRAAFFVEGIDTVARRLGGEEFPGSEVFPDQFDPFALKRAELFEFMIGNTDYSFEVGVDECCHNSRAVYFEPEAGGFLPLPYDFDMSGVVNPPYAVPHPQLKIRRVTQRLFRGTLASEAVWAQTFELFREKEDAILALWSGFEPLDESRRNRAVKYLEGFFSILDDDEERKEQILDKARDPEKIAVTLSRRIDSRSQSEPDDLVTESPP